MGRIMLIHYKDYVSRWNEIVEIFSPEAVRKGSFAKYAEGMKGKKGTADVDDAFLQEIERWREALAKNIALRNDDIDIAGLNYSVQMTIDRIVFLRICEERGIEPENQLLEITNTDKVYEELCELFKRADTKYNSGLFHFKQEKEQGSRPDDLTLTLNIDDKILKDIISNLYYPKSPYAFLYIPADILGQVYERFLGKVIRLTAGHQAKVEEKPEVRKAGGVYYTPTYIVEYIVKNTVGKLVENREQRVVTPADVAKLKIVDPACGSGTFLLGAYQFLLDWHLNWYAANEPEKWEKQKAILKVGDGYRLTTAKKKEILLNNIHGVDIDAQAVEVTKLSLLLKVLENASGQLGLGMERVLPDLGNNIKCGNSLIGFDYFEGQLLPDEAERARVNPFDWKTEFKEVLAKGGFDAVIGNPPYGADFNQDTRHYLARKFGVSVNIADSFVLFVNRSLSLLKEGGLQGFIIPSTWLYMPTYTAFRKSLLGNCKFEQVTLFRKPVFENVVVETCVEILQSSQPLDNKFEFLEVKNEPENLMGSSAFVRQKSLFDQEESNFLQKDESNEYKVFSKIAKHGIAFGKVSLIVCGLTPYRKGKGKPPQTQEIVESKAYDSSRKLDKTYRQYLMGRDFHRYSWRIQESRWISYGDWIAEPRYAAPFDDDVKVVIRQTADSIIAQIDNNQYLSLKNVHNVRITDKNLDYPYLLGLLNSRLLTWWYRQLIPEKGRVFAEVKVVNLSKLPIRPIDFSDPAEKAQHDKMVSLVEQMLAAHKALSAAQSPAEQERLQRQIQVTDKAIDSLVYELYGLSEEEIKIVEGSL